MVKCKFSKEWLCDPKFKDWLARDSKWVMKANANFCVKSFYISNMGEAAVVSHMQGKKHCLLVTVSSAQRVATFLPQPSVIQSPPTVLAIHSKDN